MEDNNGCNSSRTCRYLCGKINPKTGKHETDKVCVGVWTAIVVIPSVATAIGTILVLAYTGQLK